jgi:diaminohydroxyphosphoribosylaminopyrimidine deaminase/5-amino-6-(5-phosphoribosylamino)uracil reductase
MGSAPEVHKSHMARALELAARATRRVLPNPSVGAVVTFNDIIIGEGYHHTFGGPHAEVHAIQNVADPSVLTQATLYVTLEPCSHFGKTPPCVDLILSTRIPRVVVGCRDPFPLVSGRGIQRLRDAGVEVIEGVLHDACVLHNKRFILSHRQQRPYVVLKWAQTEDGFIAPEGRSETTISCPESRALVHRWRGEEMSIAVGTTTVVYDDPLLTVRDLSFIPPRDLPAQNPLRIVIGDLRRISPNARVWNTDSPTIAFTTQGRVEHLPSHIEQLPLDSRASLQSICDTLYNRKILSVLIEGGTRTVQPWIDSGLWDEARVFIAPRKLTRGIKAPHLTLDPSKVLTSGVDTLQLFAHPEIPARLDIERFSFDTV